MPKLLKNVEYIGKCYDITQVDPLNFPKSHKDYQAIKLNVNNTNTSADGRFLYPKGTDYSPIAEYSYNSIAWSLFTAYDFQKYFSNIVNSGLSIPGICSFGNSTTYSEFIKKTGSRQNMVAFSHAARNICSLALKVNYSGQEVVMDDFLKARINELSADYKPQTLEAYKKVVNDFGTHYAKRVTFGGLAYRLITISISAYTELVQSGIDVNNQAEWSLDLDLKITSGTCDQRAQFFESKTHSRNEQIKFIGGTPELDWNKMGKKR